MNSGKLMCSKFTGVFRGGAILLLLFLTACAGHAQQTAPAEPASLTQDSVRILITNDDGIESEGIRQLAIAVAEFAEVVVVAPEGNESGAGQSSRIMRVRAQATPVHIDDSLQAWALNGTPSDCAAFGIRVFGREEPFDLVLSGVNYGANHGSAYLYSGTVGAAMQGLADGVPAIAVSQDHHRPDYSVSVPFAVKVVKSVLAQPMPEGILLNVNIPDGEIQGVRAVPADGNVYNVEVEVTEDDVGVFYKPVILPVDQPYPGYDIEAFRAGYITVTPLKLDRNAYDSLENVKNRSFVVDTP
jgi:5'-nucleotidase